MQALQSIAKEQTLSDAILKTLQGVSPIVCRELAYRACKGIDLSISQLEPCHWSALEQLLHTLFDTVKMGTGKPYMAVNLNGKPMDFSFMPIEPVSYTHLDVYKRQAQACLCIRVKPQMN